MPASIRSLNDESQTPGRFNDHQDYVDNCRAHARLTSSTCFFIGNHLVDFERYLRSGLDQGSEGVFAGACPPTLHDFAPDAVERTQSIITTAELECLRDDSDLADGQAQLLFMRGHVPSADLIAIGATLGIHHEFFYDHVSEYAKRRQHGVLSQPALPSLLRLAPRLRIYTLGQLRTTRKHEMTASHVRRMRERCDGAFGRFLDQARSNDMQSGASLLRGCSIHSASDFSLEQDISITVRRTRHGFVVLAWLDVGENLAKGPAGQEFMCLMNGRKDETFFFPTVQHWRDHDEVYPEHLDRVMDEEGIPQNVLHLHDQYGHSLEGPLACSSFYVASELFDFAAASERECLNRLRFVIRADIANAIGDFEQGDVSLQNLLHNHQVLREHVERLQDNLLSIEAFREWPSTHRWQDGDEQQRCCCKAVQEKALQLRQDYECLLRRARELAEECREGTLVVVRVASMEDSKRSLAQAKEVEDLTRLAFLFVPLGFVTSFFGMNFAEFGQGAIPLWVYFALAGPTLLCSMVLMSERLRRLVRSGPRRILRWKGKRQRKEVWRGQV